MISKDRAIFMALFFLSGSILFGAGLIIWYFMAIGAAVYADWMAAVITLLFILFAGSMTFFSAIFAYTALTGKNFGQVKGFRRVAQRLTLPVVLRTGKMLGVEKDRIVRAFVNINNEIVRNLVKGKKPESILVLLPHCLQLEDCELKLTSDIGKCVGCGKCDIKDLVEIAEKYNLAINVATGGTVARRIVKDTKPDVILAVACERDLLSGIQDTYPLPVIGFCNRRPSGECRSTRVNVSLIEDEIKKIYNDQEAI
ncbi:MAG: hypothetical protein C0602_03680 [Denitrovibrio sp.]|nr:MAG: hypothetical protein C0602_03680 [Denitrovibrio sp.]